MVIGWYNIGCLVLYVGGVFFGGLGLLFVKYNISRFNNSLLIYNGYIIIY